MQNTHNDRNVLSDREAAQYIGMSASYLQHARLRNEGPPFVRLGRRTIRYRVEDLQRFLGEHRVETRNGR